MQQFHNTVFAALARADMLLMGELTSQNVTNISWAFATVKVSDGELARHSEQRIFKFSTGQIASTV